MFRIGFVLFTIITAYTLARHTRDTTDLIREFKEEQQLPIHGPVYPGSLSQSTLATTSVIPSVTTTEDTAVSTTEKNMVTEVVTSTAIATTPRASSSWWSNIFSGIVPAYRKLTSYTGPYLLPSLLSSSVVGVVGILICSYTSICSTISSVLASNVRQVNNLAYSLIPYISPDKLNSLTSTVEEAVNKYSSVQDDSKIK